MNGGLLKVTCAVVVSTVIGWILYIGRPVLVPIAFGVIATYVVLGIANLFQRVPYIGSKLPVGIRFDSNRSHGGCDLCVHWPAHI